MEFGQSPLDTDVFLYSSLAAKDPGLAAKLFSKDKLKEVKSRVSILCVCVCLANLAYTRPTY